MSRKIGIVVGAIALIGLGMLLTGAHLSPWFLWELLPSEGRIRLATDNRYDIGLLTSVQIIDLLTPELTPHAYRAMQVAYAQEENDRVTAAFLPRKPLSLAAQKSFANQLRRDGWHVDRVGLVIVASDSTTSTSLTRSMSKTTKRLFDPSFPRSPTGIIEAKQGILPWYGKSLAAIATTYPEDFVILASETFDQIKRIKPGAYAYPAHKEDFSVLLPGNAVADMSETTQESLSLEIASRLGMRHTSPNFLEAANQHKGIAVVAEGENTAIAFQGNSEAVIPTILEKIAAEESYRNPVRQAFRLPDGTIGFEMVASEPTAIEPPTTSECSMVTDWLWACRSQDAFAIGTNQNLTKGVLVPAPLHVRLGASHVAQFGLPPRDLVAVGDEEVQVLRFKALPSDQKK